MNGTFKSWLIAVGLPFAFMSSCLFSGGDDGRRYDGSASHAESRHYEELRDLAEKLLPEAKAASLSSYGRCRKLGVEWTPILEDCLSVWMMMGVDHAKLLANLRTVAPALEGCNLYH